LEGFATHMSTSKGHGGNEDTGEQDVRGLRRDLLGEPHDPVGDGYVPHVRHKEDVPHEGSLPDFYGLSEDEDGAEDAINEALMGMVDSGELCFGWDEDLQDFVFWHADPDYADKPPTPAVQPLAAQVVPEPVQLDPQPDRRRRRARPKRVSVARNALIVVAAAVSAPLIVANMPAEAVKVHRPDPDVDDASSVEPELTADPREMVRTAVQEPAPVSPSAIPSKPTSPVILPSPSPSSIASGPSVTPKSAPSEEPRSHPSHPSHPVHPGQPGLPAPDSPKKQKGHKGKHRKPSSGRGQTPVRPSKHRPKGPEQSTSRVGGEGERILLPVVLLLHT
jgi:hypothetical protein